MTESELRKEFDKLFKQNYIYDCYIPNCETRDCCECACYKELLEAYKRDLNYGRTAV